MKDQNKTKEQLIAELEELRGRVLALKASETEWRRTEEALQESEERFRLLVEAIPQPIWRSDADGNVIEFNRRWHEYTGQTAEEAKGSGWTKALHPDEAAMVVQAVRASMTSGASFEIVNRLRRASDGSYRWHLARAVPMNDRGGTIIGWFGCATDIDDQKRAKEALRQAHDELEQEVKERTAELTKTNEELAIFRRFAEASGQGFSMADLDGHLLYLNPALCRMLDVERPGDCIGQHLSIFYSDESNRRGKQEIEPAMMREGYWEGELPMLSRQGKSIPTWHNAFVIRDERGNPLRLAVVITDITERKQAEEALRASEERFRVTFEEAPVGMVIGVGDGVVVKANRAACRMTGYTEEELIGQHVRDLTYPEDRELSGPFVKRLMAGEIPSFTLEKRYLRKDGQPFWARATTAAARGPDRTIAFALGVVEDITERRQTQEALRRSHEQLQTIYDGIIEGLLITDIETKRIRRVNSSFCRMLGYDEEELLRKSIPDLHPSVEVVNDLQRFQAAAEDRVSINEDRPVIRKDGSIFHADITGHRILYEGRPCLLALFRDITERRQAQEASKRQHELEVAEAFARARATELAEADRRKDEFLAMLAHELRNPLAPIRNGIDVLQILPPNGEQAKQILGMMEEQTQNLVRLIDDLLDVSRVTRGKMELKRQRVALTTIIASAIQNVPAACSCKRSCTYGDTGDRELIRSRRPDSTEPSNRQSAQQCGQVHGQRRKDSAHHGKERRRGCDPGEGQRLGDRLGDAASHFWDVRPSRQLSYPLARRAWNRSYAGQESCGNARRHCRSDQRGIGKGQRIHRSAPAPSSRRHYSRRSK